MSIKDDALRRTGPVLPDIPLGLLVTVRSVQGPESLRRRLLEMGLVPGTTVSVVRRAPLGDPIEISLRGYRLSLRTAEAIHVLVNQAA